MTSFNFFGSSTTAQTLAAGETGFIGPSGSLAVSTAPAITTSGTGTVDIAVLGSLVGLNQNAISGITGNTEIIVDRDGEIVSLSRTAILLDLTGTGRLINNGSITSTASAMDFEAIDGSASVVLTNTGIIDAVSTTIFAALGTGTFRLDNSGTIVTQSSNAISAAATNAFVSNSGEIFGNVSFGTVGSTTTLRNTGTIHGDIVLAGAGTVDIRGGSVTGNITGGEGANTFVIDREDTGIIDNGTTGTDTVISSVTFGISLGIERLVLSGGRDVRAFGNSTNDQLTGNRGDNRISGLAGNDTLEGGAGDDTLRGGDGDDVLKLDSGNDVLLGGAGIDTVTVLNPSVAVTINLGAGTATSPEIDDDTLAGIENATGGNGNDSLTGNGAANVLRGGFGDDTIAGGGENDTIAGESGADSLRGGTGADVFLFTLLTQSTPILTDTIGDFAVAQGDRIDLSAIDPDPGVNDQFVFSGTDFLPEGLPSVRAFQDVANNRTIVEARDTVGTDPDLRIVLTGLLTLTADSFVL